MTLEEEKVETKIECPRCGKLNPLDTVRCVHCTAIMRTSGIFAEGAAADKTKEVTND